MSKPRFLFAFLCVLSCLAAVWQVTWADADPAKKTPDGATTKILGGADRYLTHLSTDKPLYKPGETMYVRGMVLHYATRKPLPKKMQLQAAFTVTGPKGDSVASGWVNSQDSVLGFQWKVPEEQAGGEYTMKVTYPGNGHAPGERKFEYPSLSSSSAEIANQVPSRRLWTGRRRSCHPFGGASRRRYSSWSQGHCDCSCGRKRTVPRTSDRRQQGQLRRSFQTAQAYQTRRRHAGDGDPGRWHCRDGQQDYSDLCCRPSI